MLASANVIVSAVTVCFLDPLVLIPVDSLLRFLDKVDCEKNDQETPLIYRLLDSKRSPVTVAREQLVLLLQPEGDMMFILDLWFCQQGRQDEFWHTWGKIALRMMLHQDGSLVPTLDNIIGMSCDPQSVVMASPLAL